MCARLRNLGIYLYPGVPNTTVVTQETDLGYGKFKSGTQQNLLICVQINWLQAKKFPSLLMSLVLLCLEDKGIGGYRDAFDSRFTRKKI